MNPRTLRSAAIAAVLFWVLVIASCMAARRLLEPTATPLPPSATPTLTVTTVAPAPAPATETPTPLPPTLTATRPLPTLTRTSTPTLAPVTPSPAVLPGTGGEQPLEVGVPLLIGVGLFLAGMGFVLLRSRGHSSW